MALNIIHSFECLRLTVGGFMITGAQVKPQASPFAARNKEEQVRRQNKMAGLGFYKVPLHILV